MESRRSKELQGPEKGDVAINAPLFDVAAKTTMADEEPRLAKLCTAVKSITRAVQRKEMKYQQLLQCGPFMELCSDMIAEFPDSFKRRSRTPNENRHHRLRSHKRRSGHRRSRSHRRRSYSYRSSRSQSSSSRSPSRKRSKSAKKKIEKELSSKMESCFLKYANSSEACSSTMADEREARRKRTSRRSRSSSHDGRRKSRKPKATSRSNLSPRRHSSSGEDSGRRPSPRKRMKSNPAPVQLSDYSLSRSQSPKEKMHPKHQEGSRNQREKPPSKQLH